MSSRKQSQAMGALFWVVVASLVGVYAYWDHKSTKQKKEKEEQAKLLFQLDVDLPKEKHDHKHDHKKGAKAKKKKKQKALKKTLKIAGISTLSIYNENEKKGRRSIDLRRERGNNWSITSPVRTPADLTTVKSVLGELVTAKRKRLVQEWKEKPKDLDATLKKYGLDKPKHKITFTFKKLTRTIVIGNKNKYTGNYYAYVYGSKQVVLIDSSMYYATDKKLFALRRKEIFTQRVGNIDQISVTRTNDQLVFKRHYSNKTRVKTGGHQGHHHGHGHGHGAKKKKGITREWMMTLPLRAKTDATTVNSTVRMLKNLRASAFPSEDAKTDAKKFGLDKPALAIEVTLRNKTRMTLNIGEVAGKKKKTYYAAAAVGGPVAKIDAYIVKELRKNPFHFRRKNILSFKLGQVRMLRISAAGEKPFQLMRIEGRKDTWRVLAPSPSKGKKDKVDKLLNALRDARTIRYVKEELDAKALADAGLDKPTLAFFLYGASSKDVEDILYIGKKNKAGNYLVTNKEKKKLFELKGSYMKNFLTEAWQFQVNGKKPKKAPKKAAPAKRPAPTKAAPKKAAPKAAPVKREAPKKVEPKKAEPKKAEPAKREAPKAAPKKAAPKKAAPAKREAPKAAPAKREEPKKVAPKKAAPAKAAPKKAEPQKAPASRPATR